MDETPEPRTRPKQFDIFRPAQLPSANLGQKRLETTKRDTDADLEEAYKQWNVRIDEQMAASVKALKELVGHLHSGPDGKGQDGSGTTQTLPALHLKLKTQALIRSAQAIRDTAHELNLAIALGSEMDAAMRRDKEVKQLREEAARLRREIAREGGLLASGKGYVEGEEGDGEGPGEKVGDGEAEAGAANAGEPDAGAKASPGKTASPSKESAEASPVKPAAETMDVDDEDEDDDIFEEV